MSTGTLIAIIVPVVVVLILAAVVLWYVNRRRRLQQRFGPEYERAVDRTGSHRAAERDLRQREQRHDQLQITPLPPGARQRYTEDWKRVQQEFVDRPGEAVQHADRLVTLLMHDRGYPTEGYEQQLRDRWSTTVRPTRPTPRPDGTTPPPRSSGARWCTTARCSRSS